MPPEAFNEIETRRVWWQPVYFDSIFMVFQPRLNGLGMVKATIVTDQADFAGGVGKQQGNKENQEIGAALAIRYGVGDLATGIVDASINDFLLVLAGSRDFGLDTDGAPDAGQGGMPMNFDLILKDQGFGSVIL
jgi:hypothetical protein